MEFDDTVLSPDFPIVPKDFKALEKVDFTLPIP
jgi:hypothetical protein